VVETLIEQAPPKRGRGRPRKVRPDVAASSGPVEAAVRETAWAREQGGHVDVRLEGQPSKPALSDATQAALTELKAIDAAVAEAKHEYLMISVREYRSWFQDETRSHENKLAALEHQRVFAERRLLRSLGWRPGFGDVTAIKAAMAAACAAGIHLRHIWGSRGNCVNTAVCLDYRYSSEIGEMK